MSFSFRNIFTPEDGGQGEAAPADGGDARHQSSFAAPGGSGGQGRSETFLVSELLPFIPPAIAAQSGIPMEKEVEIPLPASGSNDVPLSTIYQICPELFATEITPLNESTVSLPAKLNQLPEPAPEGNSPFSPGAAFSKPPGMAKGTGSSPAGHDRKNDGTQPAPGPEQNPFWSPENEVQEENVNHKTVSSMSDSDSKPQANSPPSSSPEAGALTGFGPPLSGSESPFGASPESEVEEAAFGSKPAPEAAAPQAPDPAEGALPKGFTGPSSDSKNPFSDSPPTPPEEPAGPASGKSADFTGNPFESDEGYETLFSTQAQEDSDIPFPSPGGVKEPGASAFGAPPPQEGTWGSMFEADASKETADEAADGATAFESIGNMMSNGAGKPEAMGIGEGENATVADESEGEDYGDFLPPREESHEFPSGFQKAADFSAPPEEQASEKESAPESSSLLEPLPEAMLSSQPEMNPAGGAASIEKPKAVEKKISAQVTRADGGAFSGNGIEASSSKAASTPKSESQEPAPTPVNPAPVASSPVQEQGAAAAVPGFSASGEIPHLELKAIFSTSDSFTLRSVARRVVALSGIASCALATPGRLVQASRNEESRIGDEAKEMVETIRNLAKLTGLPDAQSFTLHTDRGIVSLFLSGECCLTVHHESPEFEPGTREKLIIVSRNLENLEK